MSATNTLQTNVYVDWNNDGDFDDLHDSITSDILEMSFQRGRDYASQLSGKSVAGKLTIRLENDTAKYSPDNSSSALFGSLLPGRKVQVRGVVGTYNTFPYTFPFTFNNLTETVIWTGYLDRITPMPSPHGVDTAEIVVFGVLGYLNDFIPTLTSQTNIRTDQAISAILADVNFSDTTLATGQTTLTRYWTDGVKTLNAMREVEEVEAGFIKEGRDGKVIFESRDTRINAPYTTSQATFSDASGATNSYTTVRQEDPLSTITNHVEASSRTYTVNSIAVLWTHPETGSSSPALQPNESITVEANYPNSTSANNALEVDAWTTPVATTDVVANSASNGSGTNLTSSIGISATKTATRMSITLTNNHTTSTAYLTKVQARGTAVISNDPVIVTAVDATSQASYGERKYVATSDFFPSSTNAQLWCDYHNSVFGSPLAILTMSINANQSDAVQTQVLARDISDRITGVANNNSGLGINADFFIESIRHVVKRGSTDHTVTYKLSPATGGYSQFWLLGTGKLGTSTVPSF